METDKLAVVRELLGREFPGCTIQHKQGSRGHTLQISLEGSNFIVVLSDEFVREHEPFEIGRQLAKYTLIEHLRDLPDTPVIVTNAGLELEYE